MFTNILTTSCSQMQEIAFQYGMPPQAKDTLHYTDDVTMFEGKFSCLARSKACLGPSLIKVNLSHYRTIRGNGHTYCIACNIHDAHFMV